MTHSSSREMGITTLKRCAQTIVFQTTKCNNKPKIIISFIANPLTSMHHNSCEFQQFKAEKRHFTTHKRRPSQLSSSKYLWASVLFMNSKHDTDNWRCYYHKDHSSICVILPGPATVVIFVWKWWHTKLRNESWPNFGPNTYRHFGMKTNS